MDKIIKFKGLSIDEIVKKNKKIKNFNNFRTIFKKNVTKEIEIKVVFDIYLGVI